jgi:hypothetical protein
LAKLNGKAVRGVLNALKQREFARALQLTRNNCIVVVLLRPHETLEFHNRQMGPGYELACMHASHCMVATADRSGVKLLPISILQPAHLLVLSDNFLYFDTVDRPLSIIVQLPGLLWQLSFNGQHTCRNCRHEHYFDIRKLTHILEHINALRTRNIQSILTIFKNL